MTSTTSTAMTSRPASQRCPGVLKRTVAAALISLSLWPLVATAGEPAFGNKRFVYRADGKKLADVLQDFAASQGVPVVVDPSVDGVVNANFNTRSAEFLTSIMRAYNVIWYFDGTTLFFYPSHAMQSKLFRMRGYDRSQVRRILSSLGLGDARFPLRFDDSNQTLLAYGPPRHIELISTLLEQLERDGQDRLGTSIRVVPLRYATAMDQTVGNTHVPGLVSTLNNLFSGAGKTADGASTPPDSAANASHVAERLRAAQASYGLKLQGSATPVAGSGRSDTHGADQLASAAPATSLDAERPFFQAEPASNAVIVRGLPDRMKEYEALVRQLDVQQDLIEIEASIIDVDVEGFDALGIDWSLSVNGVQRLSLTPGAPATAAGGSTSDTLTSANITTLVGNAGRQLLSHISALEGEGKANILARPKVLGTANRTATMTDKRVASVRVAGNLDTSLYSVEAGTTLSVTPQIVTYGDHREVRLSLSIQDGDFEGTSVDQVPIVKQTQIDTEATVREGESLLIGGISVESTLDGTTGLPLLSKIPVLGALFRNHQASRSRTERLFLLTPKIIAVGANRATPATPTSTPAATASRPDAPPPPIAPAVAAVAETRPAPDSPRGRSVALATSVPAPTVACELRMLGLVDRCPPQDH